LETVPNIELSLVALVERRGRVEAWREQRFFVSTDRLSPGFRGRVAGLKLPKGVCAACDGSIETADQIALIMLRDCNAGMVCADCGALARDELVEKLSLFEGVESDAALFVANAKKAECAIALCCGLDPDVAVNWSVDGEWDYGLGAHFGLVRKESPDKSFSQRRSTSRRGMAANIRWLSRRPATHLISNKPRSVSTWPFLERR
jgi:hypothetical protein